MRIRRQEWIDSLHRTAPGVDWRAIENANRAAHALERQALVEQGIRTDDWTEIGSANLAGRTHATAYSPDENMIYVGSNLGGVWRGTLAGENWTPISDALGLGSHGLCVVPGDPLVVLTITDGGTCHASTNGGESWFVPSGMPEYFQESTRIVRDLGSPRTVYLLVKGAIDVDGTWYTGFHVLRSDDGGISFTRTHTESGYSNRCDLWIDRVNPGPLYLMVKNTLKVSHDLGETFTIVGSSPESCSDVVLSASEAGAPTFYAAQNIGGTWKLYRSTDGGVNWSLRTIINDWWRTLVASITDPDLVYYAGVECFRSTDGGLQWSVVNRWWEYYDDPENKLHADHPGGECLWIDGQEIFFLDTDGGTYASYDGVATVQNLSLHGLGISQYYDIFTSETDPYLIAAGSQDQGFQVSQPIPGETYLDFRQTISGDYGHLTSTVRDHNMLFSDYPAFILVQVYEDNPDYLQQWNFPANASHSWMPPLLADPVDPNAVYLCADHLWRYERQQNGSHTTTELPQDFSPGYLSGLAISKIDTDYWYAVTNQGRLWFSHDAGDSWTLSPDYGPAGHYFYGNALICSPTDPTTAYVGGSGYSGPAVYKTTDGGMTWDPMGDGLPSTLVFMLVFDNAVDQNLFAAAEAGPYRFDADSGQWESILGTEAPLTTYWCVESVPELDVIRFGTYSRGIWDYQIVDPASAEDGIAGDFGPTLALGPNPAAAKTTISFDLAAAGPVEVEVFDVTGRRVAAPFVGQLGAGRHAIPYDLRWESGSRLAAGTYLVRLQTRDSVRIEKLQILH
ncbi:MAG: T9SS type A sorting domain-containing protein [Candidatus Eisenbacteria bacterium]|nr:T9SS type A sorting domain-containing protein [Candidatus Eisenbacteria bacterium]